MRRRSRWCCWIMPLTVVAIAPVWAEDRVPGTEPVVEPQIDRRQVSVPRIKESDIEAGVYAGVLSVESFGTRAVYGARVAYHVTDRLFVEGVYGQSTVSDQFYRDHALPIFADGAVAKLSYYNVSVGYNLLPGESFVTKTWALASAFYVIGGLGSTTIEREKFPTFNFGFGYRLLFTDSFAFHIDVRDHLFNSDLLSRGQQQKKNVLTNNFEMTTGMTFFF